MLIHTLYNHLLPTYLIFKQSEIVAKLILPTQKTNEVDTTQLPTSAQQFSRGLLLVELFKYLIPLLIVTRRRH